MTATPSMQDERNRIEGENVELRARNAELEKKLEQRKLAPVQGYTPGIPWEMHLRAYDVYCKRYGKQEALIKGWCRGGFGTGELDMFIPGWREELSERAKMQATIASLFEENRVLREHLHNVVRIERCYRGETVLSYLKTECLKIAAALATRKGKS